MYSKAGANFQAILKENGIILVRIHQLYQTINLAAKISNIIKNLIEYQTNKTENPFSLQDNEYNSHDRQNLHAHFLRNYKELH